METIIPEIDEIVNFYSPELIEQIARETGFVQRESKLGGVEFLGVMTQGLYAHPDATLNQMSGMLKELNPQLEISGSGLQQRIVGSGREFLKRMLSEALALSVTRSLDESIPELLQAFRKVHLLDSTQISLPENLSSRWAGSGGCASKAGLKLQLMLDYKSGKYEEIVITEGISADQSYMKQAVKLIGPGELLLYDLGYFDQNSMIDLAERGAYFLSRFNHRTGLYTKKADGTWEKFQIQKELKKAYRRGMSFCESDVWIVKDGRQLMVRLIAERAPEKVANERRCKAKKTAKKKGRKPTKKHLYLMNWSLYITNAEREKLLAKAAGVVYPLRWYIELVFKSWKSYHGLAQVRGIKEERIECFIYGRLIMIVIMAFLFGSIKRYLWITRGREASLLKVVGHFQVKAYKALSVMMNSESFARFLFTEFLEACRLCMMDSRKRPTTDQKLRVAKAA
jgi:hypothetical protein